MLAWAIRHVGVVVLDWIAHYLRAHWLFEVMVFYGLPLKRESLFLAFTCWYVSVVQQLRKSIAAMYSPTDPGIPTTVKFNMKLGTNMSSL